MKSLTCLVLLVSLAACVSVDVKSKETASAANIAGYDMPHFKRPNLLVANMERSLVIYRDILGFEGAPIVESSPDSFSYPVFNIPREARMRYTYLGEPGEARVLGLTEVTGIDLPRAPKTPLMSASVIGVSGLEEKMKQIEALGLEVTESKIAGGAEFRFIEQAFVDYDGHLIVLFEILGK